MNDRVADIIALLKGKKITKKVTVGRVAPRPRAKKLTTKQLGKYVGKCEACGLIFGSKEEVCHRCGAPVNENKE